MGTVGDGPSGDRTSALLSAIAQVLGPEDQVAGTGFLVADGVLATCAHVVRAAGAGPGEHVRLVFPHDGGAQPLDGLVLEEPWRAPEDEDVAMVQLPDGTAIGKGLPLGSAAGCRGHRVRSFGFPAQAPVGGHFGVGVAGDLLPAAEGRGMRLQLTAANDLTTGFSGGPVVDETTGLIIGMLTEITAPDEYERGQGIAYVTPTQVLREVWPELCEQDVCPYQGLESFTTEEAHWFEGRKDAVRQVLANLAEQQRVTLLLGPSGSGKSSLIQAGVLPALADGALPGSDSWLPILARPRQDLLTEVERSGLPGAVTAGIAAAVALKLQAEPSCRRVLLIIDQFEELLTQTATSREQERRLAATDQITRAVRSHADLDVILVMRDDFYPRQAALAPKLLEAAMPGLLNIPGTLSQDDLQDIITLPAEKAGARFEPGLAKQIIADVLATTPEGTMTRQAPVTVLPLLELALSQLWQKRQDGYLTHDAYRRIGGVTGSLTTWCDTALDQLPPEHRPIAQRILTSLVRSADPRHNIPAIREQVPLQELREMAADVGDGTDNGQAVDDVLAALTRHRIITTHTPRVSLLRDAPPEHPVAELIHDALIRDWGTLREWVSQDHRFQEWLDHTRARCARSSQSNDPGDLLGGTALAEGLEWAEQRRLPGDINAYLTASREHQQAVIRRSRRLNAVLAGLLALALIAVGGAVWQWRTVAAERQEALSRQLATQSGTLLNSSPDLAALLAVQAYRSSHTPEATESLENAAGLPLQRRFTGHAEDVKSVAFSPDGRTLAAGGPGTPVRLWDVSAGTTRATLPGQTDALGVVAFSPDGRTLATARADHTVELLDVDTGETVTALKGHTATVWDLAFSPDGATLATTSDDATVRLWDVASGTTRAILPGQSDVALSVAFSRDGEALATGGFDTTVRLWDPATGKSRAILRGHTGEVNSVAFSPDGKTLASGSSDNTVRLWDTATGEPRATLEQHVDAVTSVSFSPDGVALASGGNDNTIRLWDVATGTAHGALNGHAEAVNSVAFSPNGHTLATGSNDNTVRLWDTSTAKARATLEGHTDDVTSVAFSPDGKTLATGSADTTVRLWDTATGKTRDTLEGHTDLVWSVAFSPDGKTVATGSADTTVRLWDTATGKTRDTLKGHTSYVNSVAFSPDGKTLATGSTDGTVQLWDTTTGRNNATLEHTYSVALTQFSPDGRILATGNIDNKLGLWDVATGKNLVMKAEHTGAVWSVAFAPDGRSLATGSGDATAQLWDVDTATSRTTLSGHSDDVTSVAFSPDGKTLATGSDDTTIRLWDTATGKRRATLPQVDKVSAVAFSPDGHTLATGSADDTVRLWDVALPQPDAAIQKICQAVNRDLTRQERSAYLQGQSAGVVCPVR
ncbi:trypsin-like peptidase domain-containing protein [Streptomyces yangpuensis]|uniref:nSTAND1 domain-containing NTPase n=1 Tax=Streptomyces yangpuensis TaxID=1648182 RepID=UPI00380CEDC1